MPSHGVEMCPFCKVEHERADFGSMKILLCPMTPPGELWYFNTKYMPAGMVKNIGD